MTARSNDFTACLPSELCDRVLSNFTSYEARPLSHVSRAWRNAAKQASAAGVFERHVLVVTSKDSKCYILKANKQGGCDVVECISIRAPCDEAESPSGWATAVRPTADGRLLFSQYNAPGLLAFAYDPKTRSHRCARYSPNPAILSQEGIAEGFPFQTPSGRPPALYVASAEAGADSKFWIHRLDPWTGATLQKVSVGNARRGTGGVPWTLEVGPDGALYAATHWDSDEAHPFAAAAAPAAAPAAGLAAAGAAAGGAGAGGAPAVAAAAAGVAEAAEAAADSIMEEGEDDDYHMPTLKPSGDSARPRELDNTGAVFRLRTGRNGVLRGSGPNALCGRGVRDCLNRPSGLAFDSNSHSNSHSNKELAHDLYVTSFAAADGRRRIVRFRLPSSLGAAAALDESFVCPTAADDPSCAFAPWDVAASGCGTIWAVSHHNSSRGGGDGGCDAVAEFSLRDGAMLRKWDLPELRGAEPNCVALTPASLAFCDLSPCGDASPPGGSSAGPFGGLQRSHSALGSAARCSAAMGDMML